MMWRVFGFLTGTALGVGTLLMVLGMPVLPDAPTVIASNTPETVATDTPAPAALPEATPGQVAETAVDSVAELITDPIVAPIVESAAEPVVESHTDPAAENIGASEAMAGAGEALPDPPPLVEPEPPFAVLAEPPAPAHEPLWHSFWNPFRSQIAANGFASRLTAVTDIDYRVLRVDTGVYQVAFAYGDDTERRAKLDQIRVATGLDLPEIAP